MPSTIQNKVFRELRFPPGFAKQRCDCCQMTGCGTLGGENPSFASCATSFPQDGEGAITHWYTPPSFIGLTVWHKDHTIVPIQVLDAHTVKLPFVSHSCIPH